MIFTITTKDALHSGKGKPISKDRYEFHEGAKKPYIKTGKPYMLNLTK